VHAGDPDIEDAHHLVTEKRKGHARLLGHGQVAGAGRHHRDNAARLGPRPVRVRRHHHRARALVVHSARHGIDDGRGLVRVHARGQRAMTALGHCLENMNDLLGALPFAQHHLGNARAQHAVMVHPDAFVELLEGQHGQLFHGRVRGHPAGGDLLEQATQSMEIHARNLPYLRRLRRT
jgi:hypothetical protein